MVQESSSRLAAWLAGNRARAAGTRRRNRLATQMRRTSVMRAPILSSEARQLRLTAVAEMKTTTAITPNAINMAHLKGKPHKTRLLQCTNGVVMKELPFGSKFKQRGARFLSSRNKNGPVRRRPLNSNRKKIRLRRNSSGALTAIRLERDGANPISVAVEFPLSELPRGAL